MYSYKKEVQFGNERINRLLLWSEGKKQAPIQLDVELHKRCNLKCLPCSRQATFIDINKESKKKELPVKKWILLVKEAKKLGALIWNIEGAGEPFAHSHLTFKVMKEVKKQKIYGIITTNGTLLSDRLAKKVVEIEWDRIHFSLDGHTEALNDNIRGKGSYEATIKAIRALNKWKKYYQIENPMLNINTVINNQNYKFLPELVEFANLLHVDFIFLEPLINYHKAAESLKLNDQQIKELDSIVVQAKALANKYKIDNNFGTKDENLKKELVEKTSNMNSVLLEDVKEIKHPFLGVPCFKPWDTLAIKFDGKTGHCGLIEEGESVKDKSLQDIWFGEHLNQIRKNMQKKILMIHCANCCASDITQRRRFREELKKVVKNG